METMEGLKRRINTAGDLHSLVRTMKALAAVNIRQLEHAVESLSDYSRTIELGLRAVLRTNPQQKLSVSKSVGTAKPGVIVIGSDQGMCGPLNDQIVAYCLEELGGNRNDVDHPIFLAIGARAGARLQDVECYVDATLAAASSTSGLTPLVQDVLLQIDRWHSQHAVDRVLLFYCEHLSRASYRTRSLNLLPLDRAWLAKLEATPWPTQMLPMFTMDSSQLFSSLVRQYLFVSIYRACTESMASENASRLAAMRGAERNIGDRIMELTHQFNQQRQMTITAELLDITSAFEAMESMKH